MRRLYSPAVRTCFLLLGAICFGSAARAQQSRPWWVPPHPPRRDHAIPVRIRTVKPYWNIMTTLGHFGGFSGYGEGGFGIGYERFVNREGTLSAHLPLFVFWGADGRAGEPGYNEVRTNIKGFFFEPGFLYHPFGNRQKADVAIGLGAAIGELDRTSTTYNSFRILAVMRNEDPLFALMAKLHFNVHRPGGYVFGIYTHIGPVLSETGLAQHNGSRILWQFGIKMGGAW